jgi:hypothetical protein
MNLGRVSFHHAGIVTLTHACHEASSHAQNGYGRELGPPHSAPGSLRCAVHWAGDTGCRALQTVRGMIELTSSARAAWRIWLPLQRNDGGQAGGAPHYGIFRVDSTYRGNDKRCRRIAPAATLRPHLQQSSMTTSATVRCVACPVVLHQATQDSGAQPGGTVRHTRRRHIEADQTVLSGSRRIGNARSRLREFQRQVAVLRDR